MSEILNSYIERLAQALGISNASAASRPSAAPSSYQNSTSDKPSAYLDSGPVSPTPQAETSASQPSNDISLPVIKGLPGHMGQVRTPGLNQATADFSVGQMGQSRQTLEPQLKFGHDVFMNPIQMEKETSDKPESDPMTHAEDIIKLLSEAEDRGGIAKEKQNISGHGTKSGAMAYSSPHAYGGRDMSEDEALEYMHFLGNK